MAKLDTWNVDEAIRYLDARDSKNRILHEFKSEPGLGQLCIYCNFPNTDHKDFYKTQHLKGSNKDSEDRHRFTPCMEKRLIHERYIQISNSVSDNQTS